MWQLNQTRLNCAAGALGVAAAAKEAAISYCNQRAQFGQKIGEFQMNQDLIAQMVVHEEAARLLVYRAAWLADQKKPNNLETSIGKYTAAEAAAFAADAALKILGAYGYSTSFRSNAIIAMRNPTRSSRAPRTYKKSSSRRTRLATVRPTGNGEVAGNEPTVATAAASRSRSATE